MAGCQMNVVFGIIFLLAKKCNNGEGGSLEGVAPVQSSASSSPLSMQAKHSGLNRLPVTCTFEHPIQAYVKYLPFFESDTTRLRQMRLLLLPALTPRCFHYSCCRSAAGSISISSALTSAKCIMATSIRVEAR